MKVEHVIVNGAPMFRVSMGGTIRTGTAPQALAMLRDAIRAEQASHQQLQRAEAEAHNQVHACIGRGDNATAARAEVTRIQADMAGAAKHVARLEELTEDVRASAISATAAPLREQFRASQDAAIAALPTIPSIPTQEPHHAD
jgi:seryl-tRNA synthetase